MENLRPVQRRSVPDEVADQLADGIIDGGLPAGDALPSERDLAERLNVSRPTVRAALAKLVAAGLVETRQGGGTTVRDYRRFGGLDLLPRLVLSRTGIDARVIRDVMRTRLTLGAQAARQAAQSGVDDAGAVRLRSLRAAIAEAGDDAVARELAAVVFWDEIVDLSGSIVFRLLYNQLRAVYEPAVEALAGVLATESTRGDLHDALTDAILDGDGDAAAAVATELLTLGADAVCTALDA